MTNRILPAYPLWVIDPLFSVWANTDALNGGNTVFWTGLNTVPADSYGSKVKLIASWADETARNIWNRQMSA